MKISPDLSRAVDIKTSDRQQLTTEMVKQLSTKLICCRIERVTYIKQRNKNDDDVKIFLALLETSNFSAETNNQLAQLQAVVTLPERQWWEIVNQLKLSIDSVNHGDKQIVFVSFGVHKNEIKINKITRAKNDLRNNR